MDVGRVGHMAGRCWATDYNHNTVNNLNLNAGICFYMAHKRSQTRCRKRVKRQKYFTTGKIMLLRGMFIA